MVRVPLLEGDKSQDAPAWHRSHQRVTVLYEEETDPMDASTQQERFNEGMPKVYRIRFSDGPEWAAFEDELLTTKAAFVRPDPPRGG